MTDPNQNLPRIPRAPASFDRLPEPDETCTREELRAYVEAAVA
jgi:hypothetical protein